MFVTLKKSLAGLLAGMLLLLTNSPAQAEEAGLAGYVGVVSNYVWRGVAQNNRAASVQGDLNYAVLDGLTLGLWVAGGVGGNTETDYYVAYTGEAGDFGYTLGLTLYQYNFTSVNANAATQMEIKAGMSMGDFTANLFLIPAEDSTKDVAGNANGVSLNWLELGYATEMLGMNLSALYGTGTYNHQFVNSTAALENTGVLTLSMAKTLKNEMTVSYNWSSFVTQPSDADEPNQFWLNLQTNF